MSRTHLYQAFSPRCICDFRPDIDSRAAPSYFISYSNRTGIGATSSFPFYHKLEIVALIIFVINFLRLSAV